MRFTVITYTPDPEKGETGNLYSGFTDIYYETEDKDFNSISHPIYEYNNLGIDVLDLRLEVFKLGEILVLNENDRDIWGRKPSKWYVATESFDTFEEAFVRAKEVVENA